MILLPGAIALIAAYLIRAWRWWFLLGKKPTYTYTFNALNAGTMVKFMFFLPAAVGRVVTMSVNKKSSVYDANTSVVSSVFIDSIMKVLAIIAVLLLKFQFNELLASSYWVIVALIVIVVASLILFKKRDKVIPKVKQLVLKIPVLTEEKLENIIYKMTESLNHIGSRRNIFITIVLSLSILSLSFIFYYLALVAMPQRMTQNTIFQIAAVSVAFSPPTPAYWPGVFNAILVAATTIVLKADTDTTASYSVLLYIVMFAYWMIFGFYGLKKTNINIKTMKEKVELISSQI